MVAFLGSVAPVQDSLKGCTQLWQKLAVIPELHASAQQVMLAVHKPGWRLLWVTWCLMAALTVRNLFLLHVRVLTTLGKWRKTIEIRWGGVWLHDWVLQEV